MARRVPPGGPRSGKSRRARKKSPIRPGLYDECLNQLLGGDGEGAMRRFERMLRDHPDSPEGYSGVATALGMDKPSRESLRCFEMALKLGDERADTRFNMGNAYRSLGMDDEAMKSYRAALEKAPDFAPIYFSMSCISCDTGMYEDALKSASESIRLMPDLHEAKAVKGTALLRMGRKEEALRVLAEAARAKPGSYVIQDDLGAALSETGDDEGALRCFEAAIRIDPSDPSCHRKKAAALSRLGDHGGAYRAYAAAAELAPDSHMYASMAMSLARMHRGEAVGGWHAEATALADRAVGRDPGYSYAHFVKAHLLDLAGEDPGEHRKAAERLGGRDDRQGADADLPPAEILLAKGMHMLMQEGNIPGALSQFRALVGADPGSADARAALGTALGMAGAGKEALAELKEALRLGGDDAAVYANMGNVYDIMDMPRKAEECYRKSASMGSTEVAAQIHLAHNYRKRGEIGASLRVADDALRHQPGHPEANIARGVALADQGRFAESVGPLRDAVRASPESFEAQLHLGESLSATLDTEGALRCFEEAVRLDPDHPAGHHEVGNMLARMGRFQEAYEAYERSAKLEPRAQTYANMATTLSSLNAADGRLPPGVSAAGEGWHALATELADRALGMDDDYAYGHFVKAQLLLMSLRDDEAEEHLLRAMMLDPAFADDMTGSHMSSDNVARRRAVSGADKRPSGGGWVRKRKRR